MPGVSIGDGAVIGSRSVVTKNVPAYAIVAGNPAKIIRKRWDDKIITQLLEIKWWDWPIERINNHLAEITAANIDALQKAWFD